MKPIRTVVVDETIAGYLKPHQKEGVEFIWKNAFSDLNYFDEGDSKTIG